MRLIYDMAASQKLLYLKNNKQSIKGTVKQLFGGFWEKLWNMKHLMDANDHNRLVWMCDLFDIEKYNKEKNTCN